MRAARAAPACERGDRRAAASRAAALAVAAGERSAEDENDELRVRADSSSDVTALQGAQEHRERAAEAAEEAQAMEERFVRLEETTAEVEQQQDESPI